MPEPRDDFAPTVDDRVTCVECGRDVCVADANYYPESAGGYVCYRHDN